MFLEDLERRVRGNGIGSPELVSHLSKYRGLMPRLALIFEIAERAGRGNVGFVGRKAPLIPNFGGYVSFENASRAVQWCQYLESQARRIYTAFSSKMTAAQELSKKIKHREIGDTNGFFNCRDVYINGWRYLKSSELVKSAVDVLEKAAWVRSVDGSSGAKGGRPSDRYEINPKVWKMDAEEFVIESSSAGTQPTNRQNLQNLTAES